jgi:sugar/nucleoside kinase (ribokinase family)
VKGSFDRLLHLGNVVVDVVLNVPSLPDPGGDVIAIGGETTPGGGFNVMAAATRQGLRAAYGGAHGSGPFGELARAGLMHEGIDVLLPPKEEMDTGFVVCIVDESGERTFLTRRGAEAALTPADLEPVRAHPRDAVYLSGYGLVHPSNQAALLGWLEQLCDGATLIVDPGPLAGSIHTAVLDRVLRRADWLTCNAREAATLAGTDDPTRAVEVLHTGRGGVLVRIGADGCLLGRRGSAPVHVPAFRVEVVDTNGAGDAHTGAFLAALASGEDDVTAARLANAAAAFSVTRHGPAGAPSKAELCGFLTSTSGTM